MFMMNDDNEDDIEDEEFQANDNIEVIQEWEFFENWG